MAMELENIVANTVYIKAREGTSQIGPRVVCTACGIRRHASLGGC